MMLHFMTDVLGDEGRKALDACVKVKICGRPENTQRYHWNTAVQRLQDCYARLCPCSTPNLTWMNFDNLMLPNLNREKSYDIIEIHDALVNCDEILYVEKYPNAAPRFQEVKEVIDMRRASIEKEYDEATADPEARHQYSWIVAQRRVRDCFAGNFAGDVALLEEKQNPSERYDILEIHDAVVRFEEMSFVKKNALEQNKSKEWAHNSIINKDRAAVEREYEAWCSRDRNDEQCSRKTNEGQSQGEDKGKVEMKFFCPLASRILPQNRTLSSGDIFSFLFPCDNPSTTGRFSQNVAQTRVKSCYAGCFPEHSHILPITVNENGLPQVTENYTIADIYKTLQYFDEKKCLQKFPEDEGPGSDELKKLIEECTFSLKKEYRETKSSLPRYSLKKAESRVRECFEGSLKQERTIFPFEQGEVRISALKGTYDIFDIYKMVVHFEERLRTKTLFQKYRGEDTCARERSRIISEHRKALTMEYQETKSKLRGYSRSEAERQVRDCFAGCFLEDTDIFPTKKEKDGIPKIYQTYDISEIKEAIHHFDLIKLLEKPRGEKESECDKMNEMADHNRTELEKEYAKATAKNEIEHGSGFIINDGLVITNKHVVEDALYDKTKEICVSNAVIGELACEVIHYDAGKDLALLFCQQLNLRKNGICPLQLSSHSLLPGMQIFAFGFPMSHTDETALFVNGYVSGSKKTLSGHTLAVLNCSLNCGNSGGPVLCGDKGQLKVVGVATQKHFKEILTLEERTKIEKIRESFETSTIPCVPDDVIKSASYHQELSGHPPRSDPRQTPMFLLTLKLYDALETHSQFNLSNALPGHYVVEFIKECLSKYNGESKEKLAEVVNWSEPEHVNISPTGHSEDKKI